MSIDTVTNSTWIILFVVCILATHHKIISHMVLDECNYLYSPKGKLLCVRDKAYSPFNESTTLSPLTNSYMACLLPKRQASYAYKCVRVIVL